MRLLGLLYADDLVLYGEPEEDRRAMVGRIVDVYRRRILKVNAEKSRMMMRMERIYWSVWLV